MTAVGNESTRLVILRGDSASGKTTAALALREKLGPKVALIHQDYFRREILSNDDRTQRSRDASILIVGESPCSETGRSEMVVMPEACEHWVTGPRCRWRHWA